MIRHLILTCIFIALPLTAGAQTPEPILIGTTQSLTGHYEEFGTEQLRGLQMWVDDVNSRGALLGRPVKLMHYDDGSRDARTVAGFTKLLEEDKVDFLVGPYSSSLTLEASLVAEKYNTPMVATAASAELIWTRGLKNIFGADTPANSYMDGIYIATDAGAKTAAMVYAQTEFATEVAAALRQRSANGMGVKLLLDQGYAPEERDFSALAKQLAELDVDLVIGISYLEDSIAIVRALKAKNVNPRMLAFTVGPSLSEFGETLGDDAEGVVGVVQWLRSVPVPGAEDFAYRYRQTYGNNPGVYAVIGYSAGQILEAAVRLAGTTDHDAVRDQLRTMFFRSLMGMYNVSDTGRQEGKRNYVLQWQDGDRRLVAPSEVAERKLIYPKP